MLVHHVPVPPACVMNKTAKMVRFYQTGRPNGLKVEDIFLRGLKAGEVLVRMRALGLSRVDRLWREGSYFERPVFPSGIGYDAAGVIESVGPGVSALKVGDHVSTLPAVSLRDYPAHGEVVIYPENALFVYPRSLSPEQAASVNQGLFTAYFALVELARLQPDQFVLITAASSSMGVAAIQMAKRLGAKPIALTRSELKAERLAAAGADHVIIAGLDDVQEAILDITADFGAHVIYDGVAGPGLEELVWATRKFGHVIVYGYLGAMEEKTPLPLGACFLRGLNLQASYKVFAFTGHPRLGIPPNRPALERAKQFVFDGLKAGLFTARIDRVFTGLEQYAAAHEYLCTKAQTGKIVVSLEEP
jgi:NADPH:quinone reductase-like Zn-dependent oxidoreductase